MAFRRAPPSILILSGLIGSLITVVGFGSEYGRFDAGQPELVAFLILVICVGFVVTGAIWLRNGSSVPVTYRRVPGLTVGVLGLGGIVGSLVVFRPWAYSGLAGGLRGILVVVLVLTGIGLVLAGWLWNREGEFWYPLAVLSGGLALGLFFLVHQRLGLLIDISVLALIVISVVSLPIIGVLYGLQPRIESW